MKRSNFLKLNIGLGNNPLTKKEIEYRLNKLGINVKKTNIITSQYLEEKEETLSIVCNTSLKLSKTMEILENLCNSMTQECIALVYENNNILLYNPFMTHKDKLKFNINYFV